MLVSAGVNPFVMLFVALITFIAALIPDNPHQNTAAAEPLAIIHSMAMMAAIVAIPGTGILFALIYTLLLVYVAITVRDLTLEMSAKAWNRSVRMLHA